MPVMTSSLVCGSRSRCTVLRPGAIVCPGVEIGADTVVGAGAVVVRDLPAGVVAGGVPARVLREIGEADRAEVPEA